jgi:hypothetical protein
MLMAFAAGDSNHVATVKEKRFTGIYKETGRCVMEIAARSANE